METPRLVVVKVGGSLLDWEGLPGALRSYLDGLNTERVLLVVGGGKAADFLRELDSLHGIGEKRAHELALRMLGVTAHLVAALIPGVEVVERIEELADVWERRLVPALAPRRLLEHDDRRTADPLPECWNVTTDSIAARAAVLIGARSLRLLKSVSVGGPLGRTEAARRGLVDGYFPLAAASLERVSMVNLRRSPPTVDDLERD